MINYLLTVVTVQKYSLSDISHLKVEEASLMQRCKLGDKYFKYINFQMRLGGSVKTQLS